MQPVPRFDVGNDVFVWRLDPEVYASTWSSGIGAHKVGGRWNVKGQQAVYCANDPGTCVLEVAVHSGFRALDIAPHVLTCARVLASTVHVVQPQDVPNPAWLQSGISSAGQQAFGTDLIAKHGIVLFPSVVTRYSWNLVFDPVAIADGRIAPHSQARFALDTRLHPPP